MAASWWVLILIATIVSGGDSTTSDAGFEGAVVGVLAMANVGATIIAVRNKLTGGRLLVITGLAFSVSAFFVAGRNQALAMAVSGGPFLVAGLMHLRQRLEQSVGAIVNRVA